MSSLKYEHSAGTIILTAVMCLLLYAASVSGASSQRVPPVGAAGAAPLPQTPNNNLNGLGTLSGPSLGTSSLPELKTYPSPEVQQAPQQAVPQAVPAQPSRRQN